MLGDKPMPFPPFLPQIPQGLVLGSNSSLYGDRPAWIMALPPRLTVLLSANNSHVTILLTRSYCKLLQFHISLSTIMTQLIVCSNLKLTFPADSTSSPYPSPCMSCVAILSHSSFHPIYLHVFSSCSWVYM